MRNVPADELVGGLAVPDFELDDDDVVLGVIVLVKTGDGRNQIGFYAETSPSTTGFGWLDRVGMYHHVLMLEDEQARRRCFGDPGD